MLGGGVYCEYFTTPGVLGVGGRDTLVGVFPCVCVWLDGQRHKNKELNKKKKWINAKWGENHTQA